MNARVAALFVAAACAAAPAGCRSSRSAAADAEVVQPGAPGTPSRTVPASSVARDAAPRHTEADIRFMQGMIGHHAQAVEMTDLLETRTASEEMRQLGLRIELSQADEIKMMQQWLERRGAPQPDPHAHHRHGATLMPGMLTPEEMDRLRQASGEAFDRLFLELMIKHHEGAIVMVRELFATAGAGQESEIFAFATDVDADQRMEIQRMGAMLRKLGERK